MQRIINDLSGEKRELIDRIEKLESSKNRVEKILKQSVGNKNSMRRTNANGAPLEDEVFDELAVLMKRIEFLEDQSE